MPFLSEELPFLSEEEVSFLSDEELSFLSEESESSFFAGDVASGLLGEVVTSSFLSEEPFPFLSELPVPVEAALLPAPVEVVPPLTAVAVFVLLSVTEESPAEPDDSDDATTGLPVSTGFSALESSFFSEDSLESSFAGLLSEAV